MFPPSEKKSAKNPLFCIFGGHNQVEDRPTSAYQTQGGVYDGGEHTPQRPGEYGRGNADEVSPYERERSEENGFHTSSIGEIRSDE